MDVKTAKEITGGLSNTTKMPGASYSLPASACITGSKLRAVAGSVCSKCYACKGTYRYPVVKKCLEKRLASLTDPGWTVAMFVLINEEVRKHLETGKWFRWHDSGDIQSVQHLQNIFDVVKALPNVHFWLPTKELNILKMWLSKNPEILPPSNVTIRISASMIDYTLKASGFPTSAVATANFDDTIADVPVHHCPAPSQEGQCKDCRACWDKNVPLVAYHIH